MSNFTSKRKNASCPPSSRPIVEFAKAYADHYGYKMRGAWIYSPDGERIIRGWQAFADKLEADGAIQAGVGIAPRYGVGDRLTLNQDWYGKRPTVTVTRVEMWDIWPAYCFTDANGCEHRIHNDLNCQKETAMPLPYREYATELIADLAGEEVDSDAVQELLEAKGVEYDHTDVAEIEALVERMAEKRPLA